MKKLKTLFIVLVFILAFLIVLYEKVLKAPVLKMNVDINPVDYYELMWLGPKVDAMEALTLDSILKYTPDSVFLIDLRSEEEYFNGHIYGSLLMNFHDFQYTPLTDFRKINKKIVFISSDGKKAELACKLLLNKNLKTNVTYLENGINDWEFRLYQGREDFPKEKIESKIN